MFSLIRSVYKTLKGVMVLLSMFLTSRVQQMCSKCEAVDDVSADCEQCGKHTHVFLQGHVGEFIDYLRLSKTFADKILVISHNSRGYDAQFVLRRFLELRWVPQLIVDGTKILSMS